jgi:hypothetical protein
MQRKLLDLEFKGERAYLHGTDLFNATVAWLESILPDSAITDIDFSFHHLAHHQPQVILDAQPPGGTEPFAICACTSAGVRHRAYLIETEALVAGRYPYPEDEIVQPMEIDLTARKGVLRAPATYTNIETWVAMTKALHCKAFPHLKGKWLFVRGRFPRYAPHAKSSECALTIKANFNDRLTRSEILLDNAKAGEIYFSIV